MRDLFAYRVMPTKPFWLNVYACNEVGAICTARSVAAGLARIHKERSVGTVLYRLHITPKVRTVDLADVFGYGPSAPGWKEPAR